MQELRQICPELVALDKSFISRAADAWICFSYVWRMFLGEVFGNPLVFCINLLFLSLETGPIGLGQDELGMATAGVWLRFNIGRFTLEI